MSSGRPSPPTDRVIAILGLLAERPTAGLTLSGLSRSLGITKATALAITNTLLSSGHLIRDSVTREFRLGPALIALGRAAQDGFGALGALRPAMAALADEYDAVVAATALVDDRTVIVERVGRRSAIDPWLEPGRSYPFVAPSGISAATWLADRNVDEWMARASTLTNEEEAALRQSIRAARTDGFLVEQLDSEIVRFHQAVTALTSGDLPPRMRSALDELFVAATSTSTTNRRSLTVVSAPLPDPAGRPELVVSLYRSSARAGERRATGEALVTALTAVAATLNPVGTR